MNLNDLNKKISVGDVRQSQLITTFAVGSMVDLVKQSVMICGTDDWDKNIEDIENFKIHNRNLENLLGVKYFIAPKVSEKQMKWNTNRFDIKATVFPKWLYSPKCGRLVEARDSLLAKDDTFRCDCVTCRNKSRLVPSPFILICPGGHIEDFPYSWWVHEGKQCSEEGVPDLSMSYTDNKTSLDYLWVRCNRCGARRSMEGAMNAQAFARYQCSGNRPWLGDKVKECYASENKHYMQMRRKVETGVYFPAVVSALVIPPWNSDMAINIQNTVLPILSDVDDDFPMDFYVGRFKRKYPEATEREIRTIINELMNKDSQEMSVLMENEYKALNMYGYRADRSNFVLRDESVPKRYDHIINRVVAVDRLTVVSALVGFSMLTALPYDSPGLCPLSKHTKDWRPGIEEKGEGIFIRFKDEILDKWSEKYENRYGEMKKNYSESVYNRGNFSAQYVFLHTFAHLFIREISYICGYSAASISERIYSTYESSSEKMCGVLIYTSTTDADGSLGGLVEQAKNVNLEGLISSMVERGKWCSSDPVCYTSKGQGYHSLNYAACFACTLLPETSCESFNGLLDRCSVCGSPEDELLGVMNWVRD